MKLVFDRGVSREFWRSVYPANRSPGAPALLANLEDCAFLEKDVRRLRPNWITPQMLETLSGKVDVSVFDPAFRRRSSSHCASFAAGLSGLAREGSFYRLENDVFVEAPQLVFLRSAANLSFAQLVAYGSELCGFYSLDGACDRGLRMRSAPLSSVQRMRDLALGAAGMSGRAKALKAIDYVVERAASPMETEVWMLACLPYRYGGYGLEGFEMNCPIELNEGAARIARKRVCYADLCNSRCRVIVEFQGKRYHADAQSFEADRARINGLKEMGYEVVELTAGQVGDWRAFEVIVLRLARLVGKRIRKENLGLTSQRLALRGALREWGAAGGALAR